MPSLKERLDPAGRATLQVARPHRIRGRLNCRGGASSGGRDRRRTGPTSSNGRGTTSVTMGTTGTSARACCPTGSASGSLDADWTTQHSASFRAGVVCCFLGHRGQGLAHPLEASATVWVALQKVAAKAGVETQSASSAMVNTLRTFRDMASEYVREGTRATPGLRPGLTTCMPAAKARPAQLFLTGDVLPEAAPPKRAPPRRRRISWPSVSSSGASSQTSHRVPSAGNTSRPPRRSCRTTFRLGQSRRVHRLIGA
jgi:hypothetical protein